MLTPLVVYLAGVAIGIWRVDADPVARVALALLWPLGAAAAVVTISLLVLAAMGLFPVVGGAVVAAAGLAWWLMR